MSRSSGITASVPAIKLSSPNNLVHPSGLVISTPGALLPELLDAAPKELDAACCAGLGIGFAITLAELLEAIPGELFAACCIGLGICFAGITLGWSDGPIGTARCGLGGGGGCLPMLFAEGGDACCKSPATVLANVSGIRGVHSGFVH